MDLESQYCDFICSRFFVVQKLKKGVPASFLQQINPRKRRHGDAHEAFVFGDITEKQLDMIKAIFDDTENHSVAAFQRMNEIIGNLQGEVSMLKNDTDYRKEFVVGYKNT